ncbi:hypothetical protein B0H21DRAFT_820804 [Amylocystis lapponica]|nr:hypothetical protein B0H21DRAFT_820804 [Amylocystis lapponica]
MPSYFISGASRGIGFAMVEALLEDSQNIVVAGVRDPSRAQVLNNLRSKHSNRLLIVPFDLGDSTKIEKAAELAGAFLPNGLDCLINNAGVNHQPLTTFSGIDLELIEDNIRLNAIGPILVLRAFLPLIRKGHDKKVVFISSLLGSVDWASDWGDLSIAYSMSKAALNMMARRWAASLRAEKITTVVIHPGLRVSIPLMPPRAEFVVLGWVATGMGFVIEAWISVHYPHLEMISKEESARGCLKVIRNAKLEDETAFMTWDGGQMQW